VISEYTALEGKWLPRPKFDAICEKWEKALPELQRLTDERENDPYFLNIQHYTRSMKGKPFFGNIVKTNAYSIGKGARPIALFIQEARDRREGHAREIERVYTPFLKALQKHFEEEFLQHFDYKRREGFEAYIVWILNSGGAYVDHARDHGRASGLSVSSRAHYNFKKRLAITYLENAKGLSNEDLQSLSHEMVHYFQDAYAPYGIGGMSSFWLVEGMAEWISTFSCTSYDGPFYFQSKNNGRIDQFLRVIRRLDGDWPIPLISLVDIDNSNVLGSAIGAAIADDPRIAEMGSKTDVHTMLVSWTYAFGYCLCRYLYAEKEEAFFEYLNKDFNGEGGMDEFMSTFGIKNLSRFEKELVEFYSD